MRKKLLDFMQGRFGILWCMAVLLSAMFPAKALLSGQEQVDCPSLAGAQGVENARLDAARPTEICKLLTNKTAAEKAQIKSREIARRDFKGEYTNTQYGVRVEIIGEVKEININGQSGIELFAKAWRGDKQLGFGKDGSVEIERFRIFNPPLLVDDPNGDIVREWTDKETGLLKQRKLQEAPLQAIKEVIAHNVTLIGKDNGKIVIGKVGNTTSTFYPDSNPESTSVDGDVQDTGLTSWADKVAGTGEGFYDSTATMFLMHLDSSFSSNQWNSLRRGIALFDTSAIGDTDTIDSATLSFYGSSKGDQSTYAPDVNIYSSNPTSNTSLVSGDFATFGSTAFSTAITYAGFSTTGYNDFVLNASGLANISKTGISKFGTRNASYDVANTSPTWAADASAYLIAYSADQTGTANAPKLVIVHSAPTPTPSPTPTPTPTPTDTTAPSGSVSINSGASYTNSTSVTLTLSATDSVGVVGYYASTSSSTPTASASGWNSVTSTTSYTGSVSYSLSSGEGSKTIYAWYKDAAGNVSSTANATITLDTTVPTVTISSPTSSSTYTTTSSTINLGGSASDSSSGISSVA